MFKRILVATDVTTPSNHAVKAAAALVKGFGAALTVFHASRSYQSVYVPKVSVLRGRSRRNIQNRLPRLPTSC